MERTEDYVRLSLSIGIDEDLKMILDKDPGLMDPPVARASPLNWSPVPSVPPTFKTATPTTRTHIKQLLMKEKALEDSKREQKQKLLEQQKQEQERQRLETESKKQEKQPRPYPRIQNTGVHFDVPSQVFKVNTVLENPTQYHVVQKQKMQLRQYLDEVCQRRSSLPMSQTNSVPPTMAPGPAALSLPPQTTSLPAHPLHNLTGVSSSSPDVAMSPGLSSVATSASEGINGGGDAMHNQAVYLD